MRTHPQKLVYGGALTYTLPQFDAVINATANFAENNQDLKAAIVMSLAILQGQYVISLSHFYDAPKPPVGTFDAFLSIPHIGTLQTLTLLEIIQSPLITLLANNR